MSEQPKFPEKPTHHFLKNLDKRPGERSICKGFRYKSWDDRLNSPKSGTRIFQPSNGSKIARMAPISTIFWRNRSRRSKFLFSKILHRRKNFRRTDLDRDQCETDPRPKTGPDRTGFRYRSDGPDEDRFIKKRSHLLYHFILVGRWPSPPVDERPGARW